MEFRVETKETVILDPNQGMVRKAIPSEIRRDPLTGRTARICHFMKLNWPLPDFEAMVAGTEEYCPFCPDKIMKVTPGFPEELIPEGRIIQEDRIIFPNIAPYDGLSFVAVMSGRHFIPMVELTFDLIRDNLAMCLDFFRTVHDTGHPESVYHLINWNYMPPAGSSLIHPHLQVFVTGHAPNLMRQENEAARAYFEKTGANFWSGLAGTEEEIGERFLARTGRTVWLSSFTPMGVAGDVVGIVEGASSTLDLTGEDLDHLSQGLVNSIRAYKKMGIYSFNMNFFTGRQGDESAGFHILFSPRTFFNQTLSTPDVGAIRNLYNETLCMAFPEEIAEMLREDFN